MKIDLSKYKSFDVEIKTDIVKNLKSILEPHLLKSPLSYNFFYDDIYYLLPKYRRKDNAFDLEEIDYKYYTKREEKFIVELPSKLYIEEGQFEIPYEYYKSAYIEFFDILIENEQHNLDLTPKTIEFTIDDFGRLHVQKECLANFIYCKEKKLSTIKCNIKYSQGITSESNFDLAKEYLEPYIILTKTNKPLEEIAGKNTKAYSFMKKIDKDKLDFFLPYFYSQNYIDYLSKEAKLIGSIFSDGSYLFFDGKVIVHSLIWQLLLDIEDEFEFERKNTIKLDTWHTRNYQTMAIYSLSFINKYKKALETLQFLQEKISIEEDILPVVEGD